MIQFGFYNSAVSVYSQVIKEINSNDVETYNIFASRLLLAAENACHGWGFYDDMTELYYEIIWLDEDE